MNVDETHMADALAVAARVRHSTSPNPWVGSLVVQQDGTISVGATSPPGGAHAEREALGGADAPDGATLYTTLEPCGHEGRTGPCTEAIIEAGVGRVVIGIEDPDPQVAGQGIARLRDAGLEVTVGVLADEVTDQLRPYLHHRRTGRPWVLLKLAASLDGRTAAPDGSSRWITGPEAREDAHRLRAESDAILVGAGTVRADDPALTVREWKAPSGTPPASDPRRIVLGAAPSEACIHPCQEWHDDIGHLLDRLGSEGVVQLMVEGGAGVAGSFHRLDLVDRYVLYLAPVLFGGDDAVGLFAGPGAPTIGAVTRGEIVGVDRLGDDLRIELDPRGGATPAR